MTNKPTLHDCLGLVVAATISHPKQGLKIDELVAEAEACGDKFFAPDWSYERKLLFIQTMLDQLHKDGYVDKDIAP